MKAKPKLSKLKPRDVAAYLLDRADQYVTESSCWIALADAAHNIMLGEVHKAIVENEFDEPLYERVDGFARGKPRRVVPYAGVDEPDDDDGDCDPADRNGGVRP